MEKCTMVTGILSACRYSQPFQQLLQSSSVCSRCISTLSANTVRKIARRHHEESLPDSHSSHCRLLQLRATKCLQTVNERRLFQHFPQPQSWHPSSLRTCTSLISRECKFSTSSDDSSGSETGKSGATGDDNITASNDGSEIKDRCDHIDDGDVGEDKVTDEQIDSKDRRAGIRALLDDATVGDKSQHDDFDFDGVSESGGDRGKRERGGRPRHDPAETSVLLFPGQGSQFVGMGKELLKYPNVEDMFLVASEILGYDLLSLCINGPAAELDRTIHCQPAVVIASLAAVERLKEEQPKAIENCVAAAGFSVGEFAALVFAGSISFEDAIQVIKVRAEAMQHASEAVSSGMISVIGGRRARYKSICKETETYCKNHHNIHNPVCRVANYLFPDGRVLAGHSEALSFIKEMPKSFNLRVAKHLPVSGAFHTPLMATAQRPIAQALDRASIEAPVICVHSNVDGRPYRSAEEVRKKLKQQVVEPVMWEQTMHAIYERKKGMPFPRTYEVGPGKQLGAMLRKNNLAASHWYTHISA